MKIRTLSQMMLAFAFGLILWNLLISEFGRWQVHRWVNGLSPIDVMFLILLGMVTLLVIGSNEPPASGPNQQPPAQLTRTIW